MRCILHGHREVVEEGRSKKGWARWCPDCGKVLETGGDPEPRLVVDVRLPSERANVPIQ